MGTTETFKPVHRFIPKPVPNVTILLKSPFLSSSKIGGPAPGKAVSFLCIGHMRPALGLHSPSVIPNPTQRTFQA